MKTTETLWSSFSEIRDHPHLDKNITTDVAVIGGGITGVSTAKLLANRGLDVVILESRKVGGGTSSHSTGNLYITIDKILSSLQSKYDNDVIRDVADSRTQALKQMGDWVNKDDLDCDFREVPWYLYTDHEQSAEKIDREFEAAKEAGLSILRAEDNEIPFASRKAIKIPGQNQINPMRYVQELAQTLPAEWCRIYEKTQVFTVEEQENACLLKTPGGEVTSKYVVHATHTPKGIMMVQTLLGPYREYGIACRAEEVNLPDGIFWGYHEQGKKFSTRNYSRNGENYVIVVGESHKVGQAEDNADNIKKLEKFAEKYFGIHKAEYRWGGQHYRPADLLPYIGPRKKNSNEFIATGYSTDGLVYGTLAGMIISDLITGKENRWAELYSSTRSQPLKAAPKFMEENINVAKEYLKDLAGFVGESDMEDLKTGEGRIVEKEGHKLAVYRHEDGKLEVVSAVCTHMGCTVNWNNAEQSWDCPCHGSRFQTDGTVLEGPAYEPLQDVDLT